LRAGGGNLSGAEIGKTPRKKPNGEGFVAMGRAGLGGIRELIGMATGRWGEECRGGQRATPR